jgi:hypothetical protein
VTWLQPSHEDEGEQRQIWEMETEVVYSPVCSNDFSRFRLSITPQKNYQTTTKRVNELS